MGYVTQQFIDTWRTGQFVGQAAPRVVVEIRRGNWRRNYRTWDNPLNATIPGESKLLPWYPIFTELTPWVEIPGVLGFDQQQSFEQNGISVGTITCENVAMVPHTGALGDLYHALERGWLSPDRGYAADGRPLVLQTNEWSDVITEQANVRVWQGFGDPVRNMDGSMPLDGGPNGCWTFNGLVDDVDSDSDPARLTITARMAKVLTDSRVFGWNKSRQLKDPVTFCDRDAADDTQDVGENAAASSTDDLGLYPAANVLDDDGITATYWRSQDRATDATEWVEIHVPAGRYKSIVLECDGGMEAYVGVVVRRQADGSQPLVDGTEVGEGFAFTGEGNVPGDNGGWPYVKHVAVTSNKRTVVDLGHSFVTGDDTKFRVGFRNLKEVAPDTYRAQVRSLHARRRQRSEDAIEQKWILVDDLSDIVKVALRWAGFQSWEVETVGVSLTGKYIVNRSSFLIDIVKRATEVSGFSFFIQDPIDGESPGVPVFRRNTALQRGAAVPEVRDTDLLTALKMKRSEEPLPYIIRVRGKTSRAGSTLGGDSTRRIMAVYRPPWTQDGTLAGVIKHSTTTRNELRSLLECQIGCYLIACGSALAAFTAVAEVPGAPHIELDDQIGLLDTGTGLNTRLWISQRSSTFKAGKQASWTTTLAGALLDTPDLTALLDEIEAIDFTPQPSPIAPPRVIKVVRQP